MSHGSKILVTGASAGIGAAYAEAFARRGHDLVLAARSRDKLEALAARLRREFGVSAEVLPADLTQPEDLARVEARLREDPAIGVLVNNAGASLGGGFLAQSGEDLSRLVALNATSVLRLAHAAAPGFVARGEGAIVNVASVLSLAPEFGLTAYSATKAFVLALSQGLQAELGGAGVYVQAVLPSATRTEIWGDADPASLPPMMEAEELVEAALVGFDRREAVTIPPLHDEALWSDLEAARRALQQGFGNPRPAARYLSALPQQG